VGLNRQVCRTLTIAVLAGASMMLLALMSLISVPVSRADNPDDTLNALMMGARVCRLPVWRGRTRSSPTNIDPATGGHYTPVLVPTPESLASTSVPTGLADLQAAMAHQQAVDPGQPYLVEGYSQSAMIAVDEKIQLIQAGQPAPDVTLLLLGSPNHPDGGLLERLPGVVSLGLWGSTSTAPSRPMPVSPPSTLPTSTTSSLINRSFRSIRWPT
jgi:hypothetical protein